MSVDHIDVVTGEVLDAPPKYRPPVYKDKPRYTEAERNYLKLKRMTTPGRSRRAKQHEGDINTALLIYALLMTLYALGK